MKAAVTFISTVRQSPKRSEWMTPESESVPLKIPGSSRIIGCIQDDIIDAPPPFWKSRVFPLTVLEPEHPTLVLRRKSLNRAPNIVTKQRLESFVICWCLSSYPVAVVQK